MLNIAATFNGYIVTYNKYDITSIKPSECLNHDKFTKVHCELLDVELGRAEMEDDRRPSRRETWYQGHELSGLSGAGFRGWEHLQKPFCSPTV